MNDKPKYYDKRADFWREYFEQAQAWDGFLRDSDPAHTEKWNDVATQLPAMIEGEIVQVAPFERRLNVLCYCGVWCGDCSRQAPMLKQIADAVGANVDLRFIDRDSSEELQDELRIMGALRVPVLVFLSEDFHEIGRFGDRLHTVYRAKLERETGEACSTGFVLPSEQELTDERREWVDVFERMLIMLRLAPPLRARYGD